jgi:flagellar basal-body rod modification protein FlgD
MTTSPINSNNVLFDKYGFGKAPNDAQGAGGDNMFMTLLVTQLKNQDPLSPLENAEFIQQMA